MNTSIITSSSSRGWNCSENLIAVSFNDALKDYDSKTGRIRARIYKFKGENLEQLLENFYGKKFENTTSGFILSFEYNGRPMNVDVFRQHFRLCERY